MNKGIILMAFLFLAMPFASAQIVVKTTLDQTTLVADGETEYRMRVWADTTAYPNTEFISAEWYVIAPRQLWSDYIVITRAELPSENDFFEGWDMLSGWNRVDGTPDSNGYMKDNVRGTESTYHGPMNKQGYLGEYYFKLMPGYEGTANFNMINIIFLDPELNFYEDLNGLVRIENQDFEVVPKKSNFRLNFFDMINQRATPQIL